MVHTLKLFENEKVPSVIFFEVAEHEYAIGDDPPCIWCPGRPSPASSAGVLAKIVLYQSEICKSVVFEVAEHEYAIGDDPRYTGCPGRPSPAPIALFPS